MARVFSLLLVLVACGSRADVDVVPDGSTSGAEQSAAEPEQPGEQESTTSCDTRKILCRRAQPQCAEGEVPSVSGSCYGPCVKLEQCACEQADDCPNRDSYTCHLYAHHCGPYVH